ncbi:MAG: ATP F0F1 synthase subunit B [Pseudomonadota bacterium]
MPRISLLIAAALALAPTAAAATDGPWWSDPAKGFALLSLIIFFAIVWRAGGFKTITGMLDKRSEDIQSRITEAKALRDQATAMVADAKRKQKEATEEASAIVAQAKKDAEAMVAQAKQDLSARIERREALAEARIARAEEEAAAEVRKAAADAATEATRRLLASSGTGDDVFERAAAEIEGALN